MIRIRPAAKDDAEAIWPIFKAVVADGDTCTFSRDTLKDDALAYWFGENVSPYVVENDGQLNGTYRIEANHAGSRDHVANASFMVHPNAQELGIGQRMARHCLNEVRRLGFRAMQFNIAVAPNNNAMADWIELGFGIICTIPGVFRHKTDGLVDAHIMYREL